MFLIHLFYGLCLTLALAVGAKYKVPEVFVETLLPKGFRVSIPHQDGVVLFAFHGNLNKDIEENEGGQFSVDINEEENGRWTYTNKVKRLKVGDVINYWVYVDYFDGERKLGYKREGETFTVTESSAQPPTTGCIVSKTIVNGKNVCVGDVILEDSFSTSVIDLSKWMFEHKIPTYIGPKFEFNSYRNTDETRFIKNGNLYLKPIALTEETDVRGSLDLREEGCTSQLEDECFVVQSSSFLLPPVKSAKMNSLVNFKYGRIEIQAKLPAGDWIIPIIKLQPSGDNVQNGHTQIWIAYSRGNNHLYFYNRQIKNDDIGSRIMFAGPVIESIEPTRTENLASRKSIDSYYSDFHTYTLEWFPDSMKFYFDSQLFGNIPTSHQFNAENHQYHLSLGVSVGGLNDFPDTYNISDAGAKPWENSERDNIKKFFVARNTWLQSWNDDNSALKIASVKIIAV